MEQMNFHKQKLYALIAAGIALVGLLLPWLNILGLQTVNGFRSWGLLTFLGIIAIGALTFMGNKQEEYTVEYKKFAMYAFGAIAIGALLFVIRKNSYGGGLFGDVVKTGIGLWICLAAGLGGLALLYGLIKVENKNTLP